MASAYHTSERQEIVVPEVPDPPPAETPVDVAEDIVIHTANLTKTFGEETAVDGVTMQIPRGKIFGFIGPSGSGKTTTVRLLTGIYEPTGGEAIVLGRNPMQFRRRHRERIGYMPQLFVLYPDLTVRENLHFAASLYGVLWGQRRRNIAHLLDLVELNGHEQKLARNISGGMQRRLSLAATLIHDPELVFLDEPTAGVDPVLRRKFWDYFKELQQEGHTFFITTQYVSEAANCDYVGVMAEGRLLMMETPEGLRRRALGGDVIDLSLVEPWRNEHVRRIREHPLATGRIQFVNDRTLRVVVEDASVALAELVRWSEDQDLQVESVREHTPPYDDIFVRLIRQETDHA